ncbi:MAG: helix-turn-helix transcriptional regulator [Actinomycetota bacterium]
MPVLPASPSLGRAVRRRREALGLSRAGLAVRLGWSPGTRCGWSPRTLVRLECGERGLAHHGEVVVLARALGVDEGRLAAEAEAAPTSAPDTSAPEAPPDADVGAAALARLVEQLVARQAEQTALLRTLVDAVVRNGSLGGRGEGNPASQ